MTEELATKLSQPVPRYTSYPTAPHFHAGIDQGQYEAWLQALPPPNRTHSRLTRQRVKTFTTIR